MSRCSLWVVMLAVWMMAWALDWAGLGGILRDGHRAGEVGELAANIGHHQMPGNETDVAVARVDDERACGGQSGSGSLGGDKNGVDGRLGHGGLLGWSSWVVFLGGHCGRDRHERTYEMPGGDRVGRTTNPRIRCAEPLAGGVGRTAHDPSGSGDAFAGRERGGRGATTDTQLGEDVGQVPGHGLLAEVQLGRDPPVGLARGNEPQHLRLSLGQPTG